MPVFAVTFPPLAFRGLDLHVPDPESYVRPLMIVGKRQESLNPTRDVSPPSSDVSSSSADRTRAMSLI